MMPAFHFTFDSMHSVVQGLLFQVVTLPVVQSEYPTAYEVHQNSVPAYSVDYQWKDARTLVVSLLNPKDGHVTENVITLNEDFHVLRSSSWREDTLAVSYENQYSQGRLVSKSQSDWGVTTFHYLEDRLDSIAERFHDTLFRYTKFTYDAQERLIQADRHNRESDTHLWKHQRRKFTYFLPDSIAISRENVPESEERSQSTLHLSAGRPIRMDALHYFEFGTVTELHVWRYSGINSINDRRKANRRHRSRFGYSIPFDLLGRTLNSATRAQR